jgi:hypothetical protein
MWQTLGCWQLQLQHPISTQLCCQCLIDFTMCITSKKLKGHNELMNPYSSIMFKFFFMDCNWIFQNVCSLIIFHYVQSWNFCSWNGLQTFAHDHLLNFSFTKCCWNFCSWSAFDLFLLHEMPFSFCSYFNNFDSSNFFIQILAYVCFDCFKVVCAHQIIAKGT